MDKLNFVRDGVIRLPPGFRFQPTDDELVFHYLKRKVFSGPSPASIIPEINVSKHDPWDLPGDLEQEKYFFCNEVKYPNGNRTPNGYWQATGVAKQIISSTENQIMGMKKTLVFYRGKLPNGSRSHWIMHEYRLVIAETAASIFPQTKNSTQNCLIQKEDWVLCRISPISSTPSSSSSSSNSSGITKVSPPGSDHEDSSDCNSSSSSCFRREP